MNDKREIRGWAMYDWANSAFSTTVVTALLGPYVLALAESSPDQLTIFGIRSPARGNLPVCSLALSRTAGHFSTAARHHRRLYPSEKSV